MTNVKNSQIYWGKPKDEVIPKLAACSTVILNEANVNPNPEQPTADQFVAKIKAINPYVNMVVSFNGLCLFGDNNSTAGNPYYPVQQLIWQAADETNAWLRDINGVKMSTVPATDRIQNVMFDLRVPAFRYRLADIINEYMTAHPEFKAYHIDELHRTLGFLSTKYPNIPTEAQWTSANNSLIRMIDFPVMGNGNYDLSKYHKTKSRGRYRQNSTSVLDTLVDLKYDLELPIWQRWSIINPINRKDSNGNYIPMTATDKSEWAKLAHATGVGVQKWVSGVPNQYANPDLETLSF